MKKRIVSLLLFFLLTLAGAPACAHMLWLNPTDAFPPVGSVVEIGIGWGHKYPAGRTDEEVKADRLESIQAITPEGQIAQLEQAAVDRYRLKVDKPGVYVVTARIKPGFFSMTPEGRKFGDKKEIAGAVKCTNFHIEAKTVILAGGSAKNLDGRSGQVLELVPQVDPRQLKAGGSMAINVLYNGKALPDAQVKAVYAGFEEKKSEPAQASEKGHGGSGCAVAISTDAAGRAAIPLERAGWWLVMLSHKAAYPDKQECDEFMHNVTLTFQVN